MTTPYALTGFREGLAGIEAVIARDGEPVTIVTGPAPYDAVPARSWAPHWAPSSRWLGLEHWTVERAVDALDEGRRCA